MRKLIKNDKKMKQRKIAAYFLCFCLLFTSCVDPSVMYSALGVDVLPSKAEAETKASSAIPLKKLSGSGTGFIYNHFVETKQFKKGETYALLDGIYGYEEAVASLGSGAVLKAGSGENGSIKYIQGWYGEDAKVSAYVDVITKGKDFDSCKIGGLYAVPNSGTPTEYRYFCAYSGAQNCGPLYAYTYEKVGLGYESISASLNNINKQGSVSSRDYTVTLTYQGQEFVMDPGSYHIQIADPDSEEITIIVEDSEGNEITTNFAGPLAVRYEANANGVTGVPTIMEIWKGKSCQLRTATPVRAGYAFQNWKDKKTGQVYAKGATITSPSKCLWLQAQWKDVQKPAFDYKIVQVPGRTADSDVKAAITNSLTITDNEPVSECTVTIGGSNVAGTAGDQTVTVTVTDKAGNATVKNCTVKVIPLPLQFENITFNTSSKQLQATLREPGPDAITESGFVWGIMNSPTTSLNNGKAATSPVVTSSGGKLNVTAGNLQKGVNYYARAYAVAGGMTYYSDEIPIGIGLPAYGTFSVKNNGNNTFTVTRSGGSEGTQTVYYRTVNGSAVGGTHFTHKAEALTFQAGETSKTITISENGVNAAYSGKPATAYTNADRTYQVELYRVKGGASLGNASQTVATRTMAKGADYTVNRNVYTTVKSNKDTPGDDRKYVADRSNCSNGDVFLVNNRNKNNNPLVINGAEQKYDKKTLQRNFSTSISTATVSAKYSDKSLVYLNETASHFLYRQKLEAWEQEDAWEHIWLGDHIPPCANMNNHVGADCTSAAIPLGGGVTQERMGTGLYSASFGLGSGCSFFYFPNRNHNNGSEYVNNNATDGKPTSVRAENCIDYRGNTWVKVPFTGTAYAYYGASGKNEDIWGVDSVENFLLPYDGEEPKLVAVAPMAGGLYKQGDKFTVALVFDEIVDKTNSTGINGVSIDTSWGTASYQGGADTNVLYFSGTVGNGAGTTLKVDRINNTVNLKDMCEANEKACPGGSGSVTAQVDTSVPAFTVTSNGISNGTGTAKITVNDDKAKTSALRYAWSDSAAMPVTGWVDANATELTAAKTAAGLPLSIRKAPGSGNNGKWYLHVIGTYDTNGATTYKTAVVDFGTASSPAAGSVAPSLEVSANNTNWATSRQIIIQVSGGQTLKYRAMGETSWKTLSPTATSVTVTENGYYTFLVTAGDQTVTKNVQVEKIDRINPTAGFGSLVENGTIETTKKGIYTKLTIPIQYADEDSGVKTVQYAWTNSTVAPASWSTLSGSIDRIVYTASENTETTKYLHMKVTDHVGNTYTTYSLPYMVISENTVNSRTPGITLTGAPKTWTNDMPTLSWKLSDHSGKNYTVTQPNGKTVTTPNGEFLATKNGTYTVTVQDEDYGRSREASVTVDKLDITPPEVTVSGVVDEWKSSAQTLTLSMADSQSGLGDEYYKLVTSDEEIPDEGLTAFSGDRKTVNVSQNGIWYVYYKCMDQTGDPVTGRPANMTEGFAGPVRIDTMTPVLSVSGGMTGTPAGDGLELEMGASYGPSGGKVTLGGTEIGELTADETEGSTGTDKDTVYKVTEKGTYTFQAESRAGKTAGKSVTVCQADFRPENGGETQTQLVVKDGKLTKPEEPVRAGYTFEGWYTQEKGGDAWNFSASTVGGDIILYAHWRANGVSICPYKDGEEWTQEPPVYKIKPVGGEDLISDLSAVPNGDYQIYDGERDTGKTVSVYNASETLRLDYYTVAFYDGSQKLSAQIVQSGEKADVPPIPEKIGHTFQKWVTAAGGEEAFDFRTAVAGTINLYADWEQNGYKIAFDYEGATGNNSVPHIYVKYGDAYGSLPVPEKTGYTFKGWYTEAGGAGSRIKDETEMTETEDHTLYAYWLDETAPDAPALKEGVTLPDGWSNTQTTIPVTLFDGVGVTELWMSFDGGDYEKVEEFAAGTTEYICPVQEGEHTWQFKAKDEAGNESEESEIFTVRLDQTPPEADIKIGIYKWDTPMDDIMFGLFFDEVQSATIHASDGSVPAENVQYHLADERVPDVTAITQWEEYKGAIPVLAGKHVIYVKVTDRAGNTAMINSNGLVVDTTAPVGMFGGEPVRDNAVYYDEQHLTVVEDWIREVTLNGTDITDELAGQGNYTVLPAEGAQTIVATDRSGNTVSYTITILPKSEQDAPTGLTGIDETINGKQDGGITGITTAMEYRSDGVAEYTPITEEMLADGILTGLMPGKYYVRYKETETSHASPDSAPVVVGAGRMLMVTFMVDGNGLVIKVLSYDQSLSDVPEVPDKPGFTGKWCDEQGKDPVFEHIREDMVITAVYTEMPKEPEDTASPEVLENTSQPQVPGNTGRPGQPVNTGHPEQPEKSQKPEGSESGRQPAQDDKKEEQTQQSGGSKEGKAAEGNKADVQAGTGSPGGKERADDNVNAEDPGRTGSQQEKMGKDKDQAEKKTVLRFGNGSVIVTVVCKDDKYAAGVTDTEAVAKVVLTPEQMQLVNDGETIEIQIEVKDISHQVPQADKEVIEKGLWSEQEDIPGLTLGAYVDISMSVKVGGGDWEAVTSTREPVEIRVGIPENLQSEGREHYILRAHNGKYSLLQDVDKEKDTITIRTDQFSTYAIAYKQDSVAAHMCDLCHICLTFLGICYFVWLLIFLLVIGLILFLLWRRRREKSEREGSVNRGR